MLTVSNLFGGQSLLHGLQSLIAWSRIQRHTTAAQFNDMPPLWKAGERLPWSCLADGRVSRKDEKSPANPKVIAVAGSGILPRVNREQTVRRRPFEHLLDGDGYLNEIPGIKPMEVRDSPRRDKLMTFDCH
jgi:hypothetical protein